MTTSTVLHPFAFGPAAEVWIATGGKGLARFNSQISTPSFYTRQSAGLCDSIQCLAIDSNQVLWVGTVLGLYQYESENWKLWNTGNSGLPNDNIRAIAVDRLNRKWIGTWGGGLAVLNEKNY